MRNMTYNYIQGASKIYIRRKKDDILMATYNIDRKEIDMINIHYGLDEVEEILDFIKSYENYQERKKLIDEDIKELFEDEEDEWIYD